MVKLICKSVVFYSTNDELSFFDWISKIRGVKKWEGIGDEIHLHLPKSTISKTCLLDLTALFYRYDIDMHQLQQFVNDDNRQWYMDKNKYWYKKVFGT